MPTFHFFTDLASLKPQTSAQRYGPVQGSETSQYRVTSLFSSSAATPTAYAVCGGKVFAQQVAGRINLVLRPTEQPIGLAVPVKYYVYKGLSLDSLVDTDDPKLIADATSSDLTAVIHESQELRNAAYDDLMKTPGQTKTPPKINAVGLHLTAVPGTPNTLPDTAFIDDVFLRLDDDEFPTVGGGTSLGKFDPAAFGFEIILDGPGESPPLKALRNAGTIVIANAPASDPAGRFKDDDHREQILHYMDPCAFYAAFFFAGVAAKESKADKKFALKRQKQLYDDVLAKFNTVNTVYLDLRNEHNHSLNYYRNYNSASAAWAPFQIRFDGAAPEVADLKDYHSHGWPIFTIATGVFTNTNANTPSTLSLNLPRGDNLAPILLRTQGYFATGLRRMNQAPDVSETLRTEIYFQTDGFTEPIAFSIPKLVDNTTVPALIGARYLKRIGWTQAPADPEARVLRAEHFVDNFFELTALLGATGPNIPLNTNDVSRWHLTSSVAVAGAAPVHQPASLVNIGIGEDESTIYFFASAPNADMVTGSGKKPLAALAEAHSLTLDIGQVDITGPNNVKHPVLTVTGLPPAIGDTAGDLADLNVDSSSMFALMIHRDELPAVLAAANSLAPGFDRRLALRNQSDYVDANGHGTGTQYDLFVIGYQFGPGDLVKPVDTQIKLLHLPWTPRWLSSEAAARILDVLEPVNANRKRFAHSRISKGIISFLRSTPRLPKAAEAPPGEPSINLICETRGAEHGLRVLGKKRIEGDNLNDDPADTRTTTRIWYYVEMVEPFPLLGAGVLRPVRGWIAEGLVSIVSPFDSFLADLIAITDEIDAHQIPESLVKRITRIRMRTVRGGVLGTMFDGLIASALSLGPPAVVRLNEFYSSGLTVTFDGIDQLATKIDLFEDYMEVAMGSGRVVDLHHLFVGMDVLNHPKQNAEIVPADLWPELQDLPGFSVPLFLGSNVDATTWAGDIGAIPADSVVVPDDDPSPSPGTDWRYQNRWDEDNPGATATQRKAAFLVHYWETRAKDADLFGDVYCHLLRERLVAQVAGISSPSSGSRNLAALLFHGNLELQREGDKHAFAIFASYLGLDPDDPEEYTSYSTVAAKAADSIFRFAVFWYVYRLELVDPSVTLTLSVPLADEFLRWLQSHRMGSRP